MKVMQMFDSNFIIGICQDYNLFTAGTNDEFNKIYEYNHKSYTDEDLFELATLIKKHSDDVMAMHDIAGIILREGVRRYIDEED